MQILRRMLKTEAGELMEIMLDRDNQGYFHFRIHRNNTIVFTADFIDTIPNDTLIVNYDQELLERKQVELYRAAGEIVNLISKP